MDQPTTEEILKVRRHECAMQGHRYHVIEALGTDGPVAITCLNCGRTWNVERPKTLAGE